MIPEGLLTQLSSLGVAGLLFVMWWLERQERTATADGLAQRSAEASVVVELSEQLLEVVRANTEAITALRAELRAHRASEADWIHRLTQQVQRLKCCWNSRTDEPGEDE